MNRILVVCLAVLGAVMTMGALAGMESVPSKSVGTATFAGTWHGTMNDLPGIDLTIREQGRKISGEVVFYLQKRSDVNKPWHATRDDAIPMLKLQAKDNTLTFEVEHHVCHGCKDLGPNAVFRMELAGVNEARLTRLEEDGTEGPQMKLVRATQTSTEAAPPLQPGISVQMPVASNASPMPEADQADALILTLTLEGKTYLGIRPTDPDSLAARLRKTKRVGQRLYIKADARAPYATVIHALDAASAAGIETTVLLTSQHDATQPAAVVPPNGITVETGGCHCAARAKLSL